MHISEPEIYSNTEGIIKGSMNALRVCQFGLCMSTCTHIKTDKYICVCAKKMYFSRQNLSKLQRVLLFAKVEARGVWSDTNKHSRR